MTCTELLPNPFSVSSLFVIHIQDVNEAPYNLTISPNKVNENGRPGDFVGTLSVLDPDLPVRVCLQEFFSSFSRIIFKANETVKISSDRSGANFILFSGGKEKVFFS